VSKGAAIATIVGFLLFGLACGILGSCYGDYGGRAKTGRRAAERLANAVYRAAKNGDFESIAADKLVTEEVAASLKKFHQEKGAVKGWRVLDCYVTPLGVPIVVSIEVQRSKTEEESLVIHSSSLRFDDHGGKIPVAK
jgi:hypothetical protein